MCVKGVVFFAFFSWEEKWKKGKEKKYLFFRWKFSERKWSDFWGPENCVWLHIAQNPLIFIFVHTQNAKFIRTTKNFTIEQHAFIFVAFFFFPLFNSQNFPSFLHKRIFFYYQPKNLFPSFAKSFTLFFSFFYFSFPLITKQFAIPQPKFSNVYKRLRRWTSLLVLDVWGKQRREE